MIAIVEYGVGNLFSLISSFKKIGVEVTLTNDKEVLKKADKIILPGVGAFSDAADKLKKSGLFEFLKEEAEAGKYIMGICLGMQLLFEKSYEYGCHEGLGIIKGSIRPITDIIPKDYKVPHIGWNALEFTKESKIFKYINNGDHVYFVHSFYGAECEENINAVSEYGAKITASVEKGNVYGCQFHPEKSGDVGLKILKAFCELD